MRINQNWEDKIYKENAEIPKKGREGKK